MKHCSKFETVVNDGIANIFSQKKRNQHFWHCFKYLCENESIEREMFMKYLIIILRPMYETVISWKQDWKILLLWFSPGKKNEDERNCKTISRI